MKETKLKSTSGKELLFTDGSGNNETPLIICTFGEDFSGKSRLGATGPSVVGVVPLDRKTRYTIEKTAKEFGRKILMPKTDLVREGNMSVRAGWASTDTELNDKEIDEITEKTKKAYRQHVNMVKEVTWALHDNPDVRLVVIDLFEQFYQDLKFAHYGRTGNLVRKMAGGKMYKDTSEADQEIVDFINSIASKHLILTHRRKDEYEKNVNTGRMTWSGFKWLGHNVNVVLEQEVNKRYNPASDEDDKSWHYGVSVRKCLHNIELEGPEGKLALKDDFVTFPMLAKTVFPDSQIEDWE